MGTTSVSITPDQGVRLGALLKQQRIALGYRDIEAFAQERAVPVRVVLDFEEGRRRTADRVTLARLETVYLLKSGSLPDTLEGGVLETIMYQSQSDGWK
jgi:hypothetical protein